MLAISDERSEAVARVAKAVFCDNLGPTFQKQSRDFIIRTYLRVHAHSTEGDFFTFTFRQIVNVSNTDKGTVINR